jgi:transcriptional regulator with XRE-family HTH domain
VTEEAPRGSLDDESEIPVGAALAQLRRDHGISGQQLGERVGISQAKISRIETGAVLPHPGDVDRLARALGAPHEEVRRLTDQATRAQQRVADLRLSPDDIGGRQREIAELERATGVFRMFQPAVVIGLLQTSEYARAVLTTVQPLLPENGRRTSPTAVAEAVSTRIRRQEILSDPDRRFHLLISEAALRHRLCRPEDMPAQIERLREVAGQQNVSLGILMMDTQWRVPPTHGFELLDDRCVLIDLYNTGLVWRARWDTALYRRLFDALEEQATTDIDPILDRYLDMYLDLARPRSRR